VGAGLGVARWKGGGAEFGTAQRVPGPSHQVRLGLGLGEPHFGGQMLGSCSRTICFIDRGHCAVWREIKGSCCTNMSPC
jgi:hypothetical protein